MAMTLRWAGFRDASRLSRLLASTFSPGGRRARWRYLIKVLTTPHITTDLRDVVLGISPLPLGTGIWARVRLSFVWVACGTGRRFSSGRIPRGLKPSHAGWRVMNYASAPGTSPFKMMRVGRAILAFADEHHVRLEMEPSDSERLRAVYREHGFVSSVGNASGPVMYVRTPRHTPHPPHPRGRGDNWKRVLRTGRQSIDAVELRFGPIASDSIVLDIGSGDSPFVSELLKRGILAVACDPQYVTRPPEYRWGVAAIAEALPFRDDTFTDVHASFVLMHLSDRCSAVEEMFRVTRPSGRICITPIWPWRRRHGYLKSLAFTEIVGGRIWPRRRPTLAVPIARTAPDHRLVEAIAEVSAPLLPVRVASRVAMSVIVSVRRTTELDTARLTPKRKQPA